MVGASSFGHFNTITRLIPLVVEKQQTTNTKFAVIQYGTKPDLEVPFEDKDNFTGSMTRLYWREKGEALKEGLELVPKTFTKHGRVKAQRILVVFASGDDRTSRPDLLEEDENLKSAGIKVIPVIIGKPNDEHKLVDIHPKKRKPHFVKLGKDPREGSDPISEETFNGNY